MRCCAGCGNATSGGTHDGATLVDPQRERHVRDPELVDHGEGFVDQRRVRGSCRLRERPRRFAVGVERDRHDLEAVGRQLLVQRLPHGQVKSAASPGGPREQQHFATAQARDVERLTAEVGKHDLGHARAVEHPSARLGGPTAHNPWVSSWAIGIPSRSATDATLIDAVASRTGRRQRDAAIVLAGAFRLDLPPRQAVELFAGEVESIDDHPATVAMPRGHSVGTR